MLAENFSAQAEKLIQWSATLAGCSEAAVGITRTFLSAPMHTVHSLLGDWMARLGMETYVDAVGNLRGVHQAITEPAPRLIIGSHLDTVPNAGKYDGVLGVLIGVMLVEMLQGRRLNYSIEVVGFSEEEGVRYNVPFIGCRALVGSIDQKLLACKDAAGQTVAEAIEQFGQGCARIPEALVSAQAIAFLEFHIEQGPVLESKNVPLGIVEAIAGQSRLEIRFDGSANHAGTTPMYLRKDGLAAAAEWIGVVERAAIAKPGVVATVGRITAEPNAANVVPGRVCVSLDVRDRNDELRSSVTQQICAAAQEIARRRGIGVHILRKLDQPAVLMDPGLIEKLSRAVTNCRISAHHMISGAGHDAMIMAQKVPSAMLFIRSPGGISHHPDESVLAEDVATALEAGVRFLDEMNMASV